MNEGKIYYFLKHFLLNKGWKLLAGEPPDGSDDICRIEIRDSNRLGIGSKGSYKIDLIFLRKDTLFLIELKPKYNQGDINKLNRIIEERLDDLFSALKERCGLKRHVLPKDFLGFVIKGEHDIEIIRGKTLNALSLF